MMYFQSFAVSRILIAATLTLGLSACASVNQDQAFQGLRSTLGDRVAQDINWPRDAGGRQAVTDKVAGLMAQDLGFDAAVQVGLLNNPDLQARFAELGMANADVVQAGLLSNPVLNVLVSPTTNPNEGSILEFGLAQNILDLILLPARERVAKAEYAKTQNEIAADVVRFVGEVRAAYVEAVGKKNKLAVAQEIANGTSASVELAERFHQAGNITDLQLAEEQAYHADMEVMVEDASLAHTSALEDLAQLLNVNPELMKLPTTLPDLPSEEMSLDSMEAIAIERRLDLIAARQDVTAHVEQLRLTTSSRLWSEIKLKIEAEREPDGQWAVGPGLGLSLPLFDQGGPAVARAGAALLKAESELRALEASIRAEVGKSAAAVAAERRIAERYRKTILPLRQDIVRLKLEKYNFMLIGVFDVLVAKNEENEAYLDYVETIYDYWIARCALADAVGGTSIATTTAAPGANP
jgi:outer membrane protein, heavy metal efflux system